MSGYYLMERGWQDHPLFEGDEYSRRDAWEWLIANAYFSERKKSINGKLFTIKRGQLSYSIRFLAEKWQWHRSKVERFLEKLKIETMIETSSETGQLIITICNYDDYQVEKNKTETVAETSSETGARQERDRSETKYKEGNNVIIDDDCSAGADEIKNQAEEAREIFGWLEKLFNPAHPLVMAPVIAWLNWQEPPDFELDIKPVAERYKATHPDKPPRSLAWLDEELAKHVTQRKKPMPEVQENEKTIGNHRPGELQKPAAGGGGRTAVPSTDYYRQQAIAQTIADFHATRDQGLAGTPSPAN